MTNQLVQATLIFSILRFVLVVVGVAMTFGGLSGRDVGLDWRKLPVGVLLVFGIWVLMQLVIVVINLFVSGSVALSSIWSPENIPSITGEIFAQLFGNAFAEEVIFRGFLLIQICLLLWGRFSGRGKLITMAVFISQLIFSLTHIPNRIANGLTPLNMLVSLLVVWYGSAVSSLQCCICAPEIYLSP